jgi:hypothetical protein
VNVSKAEEKALNLNFSNFYRNPEPHPNNGAIFTRNQINEKKKMRVRIPS